MHLSFVFGQNSISARNTTHKGTFNYIDNVDVLGLRFDRVLGLNKKLIKSDVWDRQILAFGKTEQKLFQDIKICIIGAGGIGSIIAEGLIRLGVKYIHIIDYDNLESTNLNRWQGAKHSDVGSSKSGLLAKNLSTFQEDLKISFSMDNVISRKSIESIKECDFIFSCVDNVEARFFLNKISSRYLIPIFDTGVGIINDKDGISTKWQNIIIIPGYTRCFDCSVIRIYDKNIMSRTFFDNTTANFMRSEGYIKDFPEMKEPAVYHLNLFASSITLYEFHNYISHFKDLNWCTSGDISRLNNITNSIIKDTDFPSPSPLQALDSNFVEPQDKYCTNCFVYRGTGDYWSMDNFFTDNNIDLKT